MVFEKERDTEPAQIAKMVEYVRKQVKYMDSLDSQEMLEEGSLSLLGLSEEYREERRGREEEGKEGGEREREEGQGSKQTAQAK